MGLIFLLLFATSTPAYAESADCVRVKALPGGVCENLKATLDFSLCSHAPAVGATRIECKNEFFAEFVFESEDQVFRSVLTKSANGTWSASQPSGEVVTKASPPVVATAPKIGVEANYNYWAEFRWRLESDKESDLRNNRSPTYLRIRPGLEWFAQPKLSIFTEVQAVKEWGADAYTGSSSSANVRTKTSGHYRDNEVSLHQGFLKYLPSGDFDLRVGRASLSYGDGLLVGSDDWNNTGRSFDMFSARWKHKWGWAEGFTAKIVDRSISTDTPGNEDLSGLYLHTECCDGLSNLDAYVFDYQDSTNLDSAGNATTSRMYEVWSYGVRVKSKFDFLDYRLEYTKQVSSASANQIDGELGWTMDFSLKPRLALGYFDADEDFNQLFPSGHKWLGKADILSRRNIQGAFVEIQLDSLNNWSLASSYHWFNRHSETKAGFLYDGTAMATTSRAKEIGEEFDLEIKYILEKELQLLLGYADFKPSAYVLDQYANIDPVKVYFQVTAKF